MAKIDLEPTDRVTAAIDAHHEKFADAPRSHLGASVLGHHCDRWIWLSFRWAFREKIPGRLKRLFRRGHREEDIITADLKAIGIDIKHTGRDQLRVELGGHLGGSVDGIIEGGVPGAEQTRHIAEYKTHALKPFEDLCKKGVYESKPMHYAQMQLYMLGTKIKRALYVAVCKNDDRMYTERVKYDEEAAQQLLDRGKMLSTTDRMPDPVSTDPSWYQCKMCSAFDLCHGSKLTKEVNCRTCAHVTAHEDGRWSCARWGADNILTEHQAQGCEAHVLHPDLVPWERRDSNSPYEAVYTKDGVEIRNGEGDAHVFTSKELVEAGDACFTDLVREARRVFPDAKLEVKDAKGLPAASN